MYFKFAFWYYINVRVMKKKKNRLLLWKPTETYRRVLNSISINAYTYGINSALILSKVISYSERPNYDITKTTLLFVGLEHDFARVD